jgi:hypothetical protein
MELAQGLLLHRQVGLNVLVCSCGARVTKPQGDDGDIDTGLQQMQRSGVATMPGSE